MVGKRTRGKCLAGLMVVFMLLSLLLPLGVFAAGQSDIEGHWAEQQIVEWQEKGLAGGYPDGTFRPDDPVSRAEFVVFVNRAFEIPAVSDGAVFSDVPETSWFYKAVSSAVEAGIVSGYPDGTFRPQDTITRQEAAVVLFRLLAPGAGDAGTYKDSGVISDWAEGAVKAISAAGIMSGYPDGTFRPQNSITRAETIVTLERGLALKVAELIIDEPGTYGPETDKQTIKGNVIISSKDVILQNTVITGDLVLEGKIGEGDVTLKKVQVGGETIIKGGGSESITLEDCILPKVTVSKNGVRVEATGSTMVSVIRLDSGAILVSVTDTGTGFESVIVSEAVPPEARIVFSGYFENITVDGSDTEIEVEKGSTVENLTLNAPAIVTGEGSITTANINANGVEIEQKPQKTNVAKGITATVAGKKVSDDEQVSVSTGGYTTPSTPSKKTVSAISVVDEDGNEIVGEVVVGETLTAKVTPTGATVNYKWQRSASEDKISEFSDIPGATAKTYVLTEDDLDRWIKVEVTGTGNYTGTMTSNAVGLVEAAEEEPDELIEYASTADADFDITVDFGTEESAAIAELATEVGVVGTDSEEG
ncbi:MAG TPA: S-layer homology domain-containing protein, partial [Firmicutes bacterium]|nr:S-layer homology domain-containing protein [Bacillota bacterium]